MMKMFKRIGAVLLTLAMLATMLPAMYVAAANTLNTSVAGLGASWEYVKTNGGSANWNSNGTTISCTAKGAAGGRTNTSALTLTNNSGAEATLNFNYTLVTGGTTSAERAALSGAITVSNQASYSNSFSATLADGESVVINLQSTRAATYSATFTITELSLVGTNVSDPILTFKPAAVGGSYTVDGVAVDAETTQEVALETNLVLSAQAAEGYVFYGWYEENHQIYLSQNETFTLKASADTTVIPVFLADDVALFGVGSVRYNSLTEAGAAAASSTNKTVVLLNNGTISGNHVIPEGVTLLIPYDDANTLHGAKPACTSSNGSQVKWVEPTPYRTLTMAADASITVNGALEVGGRHSAAGGSAGCYAAPTEKLGYIYMTAGSTITVNGNLYCWGYIYGDGTVTANAGAGIYEIFQVNDFRGGEVSFALAGDMMVFPMTQYYVQNVEVATTYYYGATGYVTTSAYAADQCVPAPLIKFIGEGAMFIPGEGSYIVKEYVPETDTLKLDTYGDCALSTMQIDLAGNPMDTTSFVLPINSNISINIHSGTATMQQDIALLPGSTLTVGQDAVLKIASTDASSATMSAGYNLIVYDSENWTTGLNSYTAELESDLHFVHPGSRLVPVKYSPSEHKVRTEADIKDVVLDINGTVVCDGFMYSTVTWADAVNEDLTIVSGGASVISSEGTGTVSLNSGAGFDILTYQFDQAKHAAFTESEDYDPEIGAPLYYMIPLASVQLQNGDGTLVDTTGAEPGAEYEYCQQHDHWVQGECTLPDNVEITWVINGESMTSEVPYGSVPAYPREEPTKQMTNNEHFVFEGWSSDENGGAEEILPAVEAVTYYAVFGSYAHTYGTEATDGKHTCTCGKPASCSDADNDGDHLCDLGCGVEKSEHKYEGGFCTECGKPDQPPVEVVYGDANGDGKVNSTDEILLAQFNAGWDVELDMTAADANGDGKVNSTDEILLAQFNAGWDVTLGPV